MTKLRAFTCPTCHRTSYNPNDMINNYCGNCHQFKYPRDPEFIKGFATACQIFDRMFADPDWDGQCSIRFASTFIQETDRFMDPNHPIPEIQIRAAFYPPDFRHGDETKTGLTEDPEVR